MALFTAYELTAPNGVIKAVRFGLSVPAGDEIDDISDVTLSSTDAGLIQISNAALNASTWSIAGKSFAAGQAVQFDLAAIDDGSGSPESHKVFADWTSLAGNRRKDYMPLIVSPYSIAIAEDLAEALVTQLLPLSADVAELIRQENPVVLDAAPSAAQSPSAFVLDSSGGAFTVLLEQTIGTWRFYDVDGSTATNSVTIGTSGQTFNGETGPLVLDAGIGMVEIINTAGSTAFSVLFFP